AAPPEAAAPETGRQPPRAAADGEATAWPRQFAQVLVEILAGFRPAKQLAPWATERVRAQIDLLSCAADAEQRPRIRRVMTSRPTAGVVEMTMVVGFGSRSRALAMRFEHVPARPPAPGRPARPARWLCTEIETS
ncbi:MAG TPA: Rv3235 family protein, partial [Streptosporangiaceae bacterium]|nr:Rv3235 family protein [Streptosporangiaceae bacterium]